MAGKACYGAMGKHSGKPSGGKKPSSSKGSKKKKKKGY